MQMAHPNLPDFDYIRPDNLVEASQFLANHAGEARVFMGGTDTFVRMRDGAWNVKYLVDGKALEGTNQIQFDPAEGLTIGAAVNMNRVIVSPDVKNHYPLLAEAAHTVASYQLRTRATIVGNLCNASPAGDTTGACIAFGGTLQVHGLDGFRMEPLSAFFKGPGKTGLRLGDIVTAVKFPPPQKDSVGKYIKLGRNSIGDLAIVGTTVLGYPDNSSVSGYRFRIVLLSVAPVPLVSVHAEAILANKPVTLKAIEEAAQAAMDDCSPIDDIRGSARYRKYMVRNLTQKALLEVWQQINKAN